MQRHARSSVPPPAIPGVPDAVRIQILATEHWSLLATRSLIWNEIFSRATMFLTVLSGAVVALSFVGQATNFGEEFHLVSLFLLPVLLVVGLGTFFRVCDANDDDVGLVIGMNRLRRAYLEIAPDLERYFVTGSHDDQRGIMLTYAADAKVNPIRWLSATSVLVGAVDAVVAGVLAGMVCQASGWSDAIGLRTIVSLATAAMLTTIPLRTIDRHRQVHHPLFPSPAGAITGGSEPSPL